MKSLSVPDRLQNEADKSMEDPPAMPLENYLVQHSRSYLLAAKAQAIIRQEVLKGCLPDISIQPVSLEPRFKALGALGDPIVDSQPLAKPQLSPGVPDVVRYRIWISPHQQFNWKRAELFLKQLQTVSHQVGFEVMGNQRHIVLSLLCHPDDTPIVAASFQGHFDHSALSPL